MNTIPMMVVNEEEKFRYFNTVATSIDFCEASLQLKLPNATSS